MNYTDTEEYKKWKIKHDLIEKLKNEFYFTDFINIYTRRDLRRFLDILYPSMKYPYNSYPKMTKKRACKHIGFYFKLHNIVIK